VLFLVRRLAELLSSAPHVARRRRRSENGCVSTWECNAKKLILKVPYLYSLATASHRDARVSIKLDTLPVRHACQTVAASLRSQLVILGNLSTSLETAMSSTTGAVVQCTLH
jgi:hypothetical protein